MKTCGWVIASVVCFLSFASSSLWAEDREYVSERLKRLKGSHQKEAFLLTLSHQATQQFLANPPLAFDEIQSIPDATWAAMIRKAPSQAIHPAVLGAFNDDTKILIVFRTNPFLKVELKDAVPAKVWSRLERLWHEHAQILMANLGPLDGCSAVMKGLGLED